MQTHISVANADVTKIVSETLNELVKRLDSFSENNLNKIPYADSWTAAQVFDHLSKSYNVVETLHGNVKETDRNPLEKVQAIANVFLNFETKLTSPDFIIPDDKRFIKQELKQRLNEKINGLNQAAATLDLSMICTDFSLPQMGHLSRVEWLYFVVYHTQRHLHQLGKIAAAL